MVLSEHFGIYRFINQLCTTLRCPTDSGKGHLAGLDFLQEEAR